MITILGRKSSANVQKVHWICLEGNIKFSSVNIGGKYKGHETEDFKKLNPNSTIPVLVDDNFTIYESNSILRYISNKFNILKNNNIEKEALNSQWIDWSSLVFGIPCAIFTAHSLLLPKEKRNYEIAKEAEKKIYSIFEILEKQLSKQNYIIDNNINLADIPIGCWLNRCNILKLDISRFTSLEKWFFKLKERETFNKAVFSAPLPPN